MYWKCVCTERVGASPQCNDTSVLHQVLRYVVDNNIIRGYQRRATPEQAAQLNEIVAVIREQMLAGDDVVSEAKFLEEDN